MDFVELYAGLMSGVVSKTINMTDGPDGLQLFCYSESCVYERKWDKFSLMARGLIVHPDSMSVAATPFPKFFNVGEREGSLPDEPFETFEKLDGSLIILFFWNGKWRTATKGSFESEQAKWAMEWIAKRDFSALNTRTTYLLEAIYPENRIVVSYDYEGLVLLAAYRPCGSELGYRELLHVGVQTGWRVAQRHHYFTVSALLALAKELPADREGFVLRFASGLRVKVKGDEYRRIHRLVSRVTPLAVWELLESGEDPEVMRKQLPEEFWADFDNILRILTNQANATAALAEIHAQRMAHLSDKEVGLSLHTVPEVARRFIFPYRKNGGDLFHPRSRSMLFREIRPTGNRLDGYRPSSAVSRVRDDE